MGEDGIFAHECNVLKLCFKKMPVANFPKRVRGGMDCDKFNKKYNNYNSQNNQNNQFNILPYFNLFSEEYLNFMPRNDGFFKKNVICQPPGEVPIVYGDIKLLFINQFDCASKSMMYFPPAMFTKENYNDFIDNFYDPIKKTKCNANCISWPCKWINDDKNINYYSLSTKSSCEDFGERFKNPYFIRWFAISIIFLFWSGLKIQKDINTLSNDIRVYKDGAYNDLIEIIEFWQNNIPFGDLFKLNLIPFCQNNIKPIFDELYPMPENSLYLNPMWIYCINNGQQYNKNIEGIDNISDSSYDDLIHDEIKLANVDFTKFNYDNDCLVNSWDKFMKKESCVASYHDTETESEDKNKNDEFKWYLNDIVSVDITDIEGLNRFNHSSLMGVIKYVIGDEYVIVEFNEIDKVLLIETWRLQFDREADKNKTWEKGDKVHIFEINEGVKGWWHATIKRKVSKDKYEVEFKGNYDNSIVNKNDIREAYYNNESHVI